MNKHPLHPRWTEKAKEAMRERARSGTMPGCAPVGYLNATVDGQKAIVPDPLTAPLVRQAFLLARQRGISLRGVLKVMAAQGLKSRNGKELGVSSLHLMLTNPFYVGMVRWDGELMRGTHQPLIEEKLFKMVQAKLSKQSKG